MNKYILTIIGEIKEDECPDIVLSLGEVVDSNNVKFVHNDNVIMLCFGSNVEKNNLFCFIQGVLYGITDTYVLSDVTNDMYVSLPKAMKGFILDLESGDDVEFASDFDLDIIDEDEDEEDSQLMKLLNRNLKKTNKRPSLDFLLEKISRDGIESLSETEKKFLDEYSKI